MCLYSILWALPFSYFNEAVFVNKKKSMSNKIEILIVGEACVGKSTVFEMLRKGTFSDARVPTVSVCNEIIKREYDGESYLFRLGDTPGQMAFRTITKSSIKKANGFLLLFDLTDMDSFEIIDQWIDMITAEAYEPTILLVGNKSDLIEKRKISIDMINGVIEKYKDLQYIEITAKDNKLVNEMFNQIARALVKKIKAGKIELNEPEKPKERNKEDKKGGCC